MSKFNGFEVGQKFEVLNPRAFGYPELPKNAVLEVVEVLSQYNGYCKFIGRPNRGRFNIFDCEVKDGSVVRQVVDEAQKEHQPEIDHTSLIWQMIQGSGEYNGHFQVSLPKADIQTLKELARCLEKHLGTISESTGTLVEIRLLPESDYNWSASLYQLGYWSTGEHINGDTDRLLISIDNVTGV